MLIASLRDLQWRRKRFLVTAVGTALILSMTLVLSGLSAAFGAEASHLVDGMGVSGFVFPAEANGPFVGTLTFPASVADTVAAEPGVHKASAGVFFQSPIRGGKVDLVNILGLPPGGVGIPPVTAGTSRLGPGELLAGTGLQRPVGSDVVLGGRPLRVVGTLSSTALSGTPTLYVPLVEAQRLYFGGHPEASFVAVVGTPASLPAGYKFDTRAQAIANLQKPMAEAKGAITFLAALLWIVAGSVIGAIIYLSAIERTRDFAVFKATGVSNASLLAGLALQSVILAVLAAAAGIGIAFALTPEFPINVTLKVSTLLLSLAIAVLVGLLASLVSMRKVSRIDPAVAFGGP